jgi:hypothetical protein
MSELLTPWTYVLLHEPSPIQNDNTPLQPTYYELCGTIPDRLPRLYFLVWCNDLIQYTISRETLPTTLLSEYLSFHASSLFTSWGSLFLPRFSFSFGSSLFRSLVAVTLLLLRGIFSNTHNLFYSPFALLLFLFTVSRLFVSVTSPYPGPNPPVHLLESRFICSQRGNDIYSTL